MRYANSGGSVRNIDSCVLGTDDVAASKKILPFLKWAGGKRWLVAQHSHLFEKPFIRYIEPFLGSGAAFFFVRPDEALLSDINKDLIDSYKAIKNHWKDVWRILRRHHANHGHRYYYKERDRCRRSLAERAAQFIYLNRTCWNGLYRVNLEGEFNVPIGTKDSVIFDTDNFEGIAEALSGAKPPLASADELKTLIFRNMFIRERDERIANIVWNYFDAVRERWPKAWSATGEGDVLNRSNGFNGLMRFLGPAYRNFTTTEQTVSTDQFLSLFKRVNFKSEHFTTVHYQPGMSGEVDLYNDLIGATGVRRL